jgi:hypothetical protein
LIYRLVIVAMVILFPFPAAEAQVRSGMTAPSLLLPPKPVEALPPSGAQGGYLFNLRPLGDDFGRTLADNGIYLVARDLAEVLGNVRGGRKRGGSFEGYTALGSNLERERIPESPAAPFTSSSTICRASLTTDIGPVHRADQCGGLPGLGRDTDEVSIYNPSRLLALRPSGSLNRIRCNLLDPCLEAIC